MAFPLTYTGHFNLEDYPQVNDFSCNRFKEYLPSLISRFSENIDQPNSLQQNELTLKSNLLAFDFSVHLSCSQPQNSDPILHYSVNLVNLFKILLIILLVSAFMASFSTTGYFMFAAIFSVIFYIVNVMFIDSQIRHILFSIPELSRAFQDQISEEQKEWISNPNKCSACGNEISVYDLHCPECGIKLKQSQYTGQPLDISKYQNTEIKYHYKAQKPKGDK